MKIVQLGGLNIYNPTDEQLLLLVKADVVKWMGRGEGKFYKKGVIHGPIICGSQDRDLSYRVELEGEVQIHFPTIPIIN